MSKTSTRKTKNGALKIEAPNPQPVPLAPAKASVVSVQPIKVQPVLSAPAVVEPKPVAALPPKTLVSKGARISLELVRPGAKKVCVAGSFNGWKPEQMPLAPMGNGRWVGDLAINPGKYEYLFVVDGQWLPDPNAKESVQNPFGGKNSVLTVSE